jgi:hypothetical protein
MATAVRLFHPQSGLTRTGYVGFSWTSLFFSGIPAVMRGDVVVGLVVLVGTIALGAPSFGSLGFLVNLIWAFVYNKMYTTRLLESGYVIDDHPDTTEYARRKLGIVG